MILIIHLNSKLKIMKKIISIVLILMTLSTAGVFAQTTPPSAVQASFAKTFANAGNPTWTSVKDLFRVEFMAQNQSLTAYYNASGDLIASSRTITPMQLPISLKLSLEKQYSNAVISSLFEVDGRDGIYYYAKVSNQKSEILLKSTSYGEWMAE